MSAADPAPERPWSPAKRIAFRFAFTYLVLYFCPYPAGSLPGTMWFSDAYSKIWQWIVTPVGKYILHLNVEMAIPIPGSSDVVFNYVKSLCALFLAAIVTAAWTGLSSRQQTPDAKLYEGLRIYVRYALGSILLGYGIIKVMRVQFPFPSVDSLAVTYGDSSPMGLLWRFMGYSPAYSVFTGALRWRRAGTSARGSASPRRYAQIVRPRGGTFDCDGLLTAAIGPLALDAGAFGGRNGASDQSCVHFQRDGASSIGRK